MPPTKAQRLVTGTSPAQLAILRALDARGPMNVSQVVDVMSERSPRGCTEASVRGVLKKLLEAGLIARSRTSVDNRVTVVRSVPRCFHFRPMSRPCGECARLDAEADVAHQAGAVGPSSAEVGESEPRVVERTTVLGVAPVGATRT